MNRNAIKSLPSGKVKHEDLWIEMNAKVYQTDLFHMEVQVQGTKLASDLLSSLR